MPFDGAGIFTRLFRFTQDRDDGVRILASRVDGEIDNLTAAINTLVQRIVAAGGGPAADVPIYGSRTIAQGVVPAASSLVIQTMSYSAPGDGGGATYMRVANDPSKGAGAFQMKDGSWWQYVPVGPILIEQFGGVADNVTDNYQPLIDALKTENFAPEFASYIATEEIHFSIGWYFFSKTIHLKKIVTIRGENTAQDNFNGKTIWRFPAGVGGMVIHRTNTDAAGTINPTTTAADGSAILGIKFKGGGGTVATAHGIRLRARADLDITVEGFGGDGVHIRASAGAGGDLEGNCNGWFIKSLLVRDVYGNGLYVEQNDTNAGLCERVEIRSCGLSALVDRNTLGSTYVSVRVDDWDSRRVGGCNLNGFNYLFVGGTESYPNQTVVGSPPPLGGNNIWYEVGAGAPGGFYPAYDNTKTYQRSMPVSVVGLSNRTVIVSTYTEGGMSDISYSRATTGAGQSNWTRGSTTMRSELSLGLTSFSGFSSRQVRPSTDPNTSVDSREFIASLGADPSNGVVLSSSRGLDDNGNTKLNWRYRGADFVLEFGADSGFPVIQRWTLKSTTLTFGRAQPMPWALRAGRLIVADPVDPANDRLLSMTAGAPQEAGKARGEHTFNVNLVLGGVAGYGTLADGTHSPIGIVGAIQAASVAVAAGAAPTKAEFDALITALKNAKLMA